MDLERRKDAALCSWFCSNVEMADAAPLPLVLFNNGCDSVALSMLVVGFVVADDTLRFVIVAARDVLITIDLV